MSSSLVDWPLTLLYSSSAGLPDWPVWPALSGESPSSTVHARCGGTGEDGGTPLAESARCLRHLWWSLAKVNFMFCTKQKKRISVFVKSTIFSPLFVSFFRFAINWSKILGVAFFGSLKCLNNLIQFST